MARGWLGVAIQEVTPEIARAVGLKEHRGAMVTSVYAGDPADKAGIRPGDIILRIDGQDIADTRALTRIIGSLKPESAVKVTVFRDGRSRSLTAVLQKRTDDHVAKLDRSPRKEEGAKDPLGLTVVNITPQVQREFNIPEPAGVLVTDIDPKGSAAGSQIQKMDIIREVDRKEVNTVEHYLAALSARKKGQAVLLLVIRGSRPLYVAVDVK